MKISDLLRQAQRPEPKLASGILFLCQGKILLLKRSDMGDHPNEWSTPGGSVELTRRGMPETLWNAAIRETKEELGGLPPGMSPAIKSWTTKDWKTNLWYTTHIIELPTMAKTWTPNLNEEHTAWKWIGPLTAKQLPLHPNLSKLLRQVRDVAWRPRKDHL